MKLSSRKELLKEADLILEKIHIKHIQESESSGEDHVAYYSSENLTKLILGSIILSLPAGPFAIIPVLIMLASNWSYVKGYFNEKKVINLINDKTLNGDPKLKKILEMILDDLKNNQDVKKISDLLQSLKKEHEKNQEELQNFYRDINSKWYLSKNPDEIVPDDKKSELNSIKSNISNSYKKYREEIAKQTSVLTRKILSSDKYSILKSIPKKPGQTISGRKIPSRYSYLKRLIKYIEEYFIRDLDPEAIKDLKIKTVKKSEEPEFFYSGTFG